MKLSIVIALPVVAAWPQVLEMANVIPRGAPMAPRDPTPGVQPPPRAPLFLSNRPNTGAAHNPPAPLLPDQAVNVGPGSGHEFQPPGLTDKRGECPGLNAAGESYIPSVYPVCQRKSISKSWIPATYWSSNNHGHSCRLGSGI